MEQLEQLNPVQTDIWLDISVGSEQHYGIGAHWKVADNRSLMTLESRLFSLEAALAPQVSALNTALGVTLKRAIFFHRKQCTLAQLPDTAQRWIRDPWDFSQQLVRVLLLTLDNGEQHLVVGSHHLVFDGAAIVLFSQALCADEQDIAAGQRPFASLTESLRQRFDREETRAFWQQHAALLTQTGEDSGKRHPQEATTLIDVPVPHAGLEAFCRASRITLPFYFKSLFAWVAGQLYGYDDGIALQEIVNHRSTASARLFGNFSSLVPFVLSFNTAQDFASLLQQGREFQRQRKGFEALTQLTARHQGLTSNGLRFIYNFHDYSRTLHQHSRLELVNSWTSEDGGAVQFYLYYRHDGKLYAKCSHPQGVAAAQQFIDCLIRVHQQLLAGITALESLRLVGDADLAQLRRWNATEQPFDDRQTLHVLFEQQAARTPQAIAVEDDAQQLSYQQLDQRASQLAHYLHQQGVGPDRRVGMFIERSCDMLVGILGTLKAGGAWLPLDSEYPDARLAYMLADAQSDVVLTTRSLAPRLRSLLAEQPAQVIMLDDADTLNALRQQPTTAMSMAALGLTSRHLAYVIYTSGSTGNPKGVMLEHRGVVNRLAWMQSAFGLTAEDTLLQKTPFGFDVSVWELLWAVLVGARLVFARPGGHKDPDYLHQVITQRRVTLVHFVPSMLRLFIDSTPPHSLPGLKTIVCSGEALPVETWQDTLTCLPQVALWNLYGPTEASIDVTWWRGDAGERYRTIPIGKPIDNTACYVVNRRMQLLPAGLAGELCLGGVGIARGYLNRPELSAERFLPDPFCVQPDGMLYRTGDLVRYQPDGNIEYLGRIDDQVKIRGLRIELGEIEQQMLSLPFVSAAVVVARTDAHGEQRLLGYYSLKPDIASSADREVEMRAALHRQLPDYMVPALLIALEVMPLSANGKINRKALPEPRFTRDAEHFIAPQEGDESALAAIWAALLPIEATAISANDSFFALGGHSLLAVRLLAEIRDRMQVELTIRDLFETPTLAEQAVRIASKRGGELLPPVLPQPRDASAVTIRLPLSFAQQRLWLLDRLMADGSLYNISALLRVDGEFQPTLAERAFRLLIARHEPLRTVFTEEENEVLQVIRPAFSFQLDQVDLSLLTAGERQQAMQAAAVRDAQQAFDLSTDVLLRAAFLRTGASEGALLVTVHHIAADGWSMGVLIEEFRTLYQALLNADAPSLPALPVNYADYAHWQREWVQRPAYQTQLLWWQQQLAGLPLVHSLPLSHPRPLQQSSNGERHRFSLTAQTTEALRQLAAEENATLFMLLHAAFSLLLARHGSSQDIVIGVPVANRSHASLAPLVGFFVNSLVLRVACEPELEFRHFLRRVKAVNIDAQMRQDVPFEQLVDALNPERSTRHAPLFQIMFSMDDDLLQPAPVGACQFTLLPHPVTPARFELLLNVVEQQGELHCQFDYNAALFDADYIAQLARRFTELVNSLLRQPDAAIGALPMMDAGEQQQLLLRANPAPHRWPEAPLLPQKILSQAALTPQRVAVQWNDKQLSYQELCEQASQLAHALQAQGVGPNSLVGLAMPRCGEVMIGLLAIVLAGAAYVPIDPAYPAERIRFMLEDSGVDWLLTHSAVEEGVRDSLPSEVQTLTIDDPLLRQRLSEYPHTPPVVAAMPAKEHLLYVIYTSGSTGRPKAAQVTHHGVNNLLHWYIGELRSGEVDRPLIISSLSFDLTQKNLWSPLLQGGSVVFSTVAQYDADRIAQEIAQHQVTRINCAPSAFYPLVADRALWPQLSSLQQLWLGGESIAMHTLRPWLQYSGCVLINSYGPTECTDVVSWHRVACDEENPPIGSPISNTQLYVLNSHLSLCPVGTPGELWIGGEGVGLGYLGRPELTAEKFIADPFSDDPQARLYRTGDLAQWQADGRIAYLGRLDDQIKIRGFRIELGEISQYLLQHEQVAAATVLAREGETPSLAAFVVASDPALTSAQLRQYLLASLPGWMVPAHILLLPAMLLTPNGKIDKKALLALPVAAAASETTISPRTPVEADIAAIFAEVLGIGQVGVDDNFFALGGHSLSATQVLARLRRRFSPDLTLHMLFEFPTVAALAAVLGERASLHASALTIPPQPENAARVLSFAQQKIWFMQQLMPDSSAYNLFSALQLEGELSITALQQAFDQLRARHAVLRSQFADKDGALTVNPFTPQPVDYHDLRSLTAVDRQSRIQLLAEEAAQRPFRLAEDELLRVTLLRCEDRHFLLLLTLHHIIADGWSVGVMIDELVQHYDKAQFARPVTLPALRIDYSDYAAWQRERLSGERMRQLEQYWLQQLHGDLPLLQLPADFPEDESVGTQGDSLLITLDTATLDRLHHLCQQHNVSLFMLLLSAFGLLLNRVTTQEDLIIGAPVAGRTLPETEPLLGCFINPLPLRLDLAGNPAFSTLLEQVRQVCLDAWEHQEMPFERLTELLRPERRLNQNPIFDVMLNMLNAPQGDKQLDGVVVRECRLTQPQAKFSLTLYAQEREGELALEWVWPQARYGYGQIQALAEQFIGLLKQIADDVSQPLQQYSLLTAAARQVLPDPLSPLSSAEIASVPTLFVDSAQRFATLTAVEQNGRQWHYQALAETAAYYTAQLRAAGIQPGEVIAIHGARSFGLIAAMLAVMQAGGVMLLLDKNLSLARRQAMLDEAQPRQLLFVAMSDEVDAELCDDPRWRQVTCLDAWAVRQAEVVASTVDPQAACYLFFTSGTTGTPKGIIGQQQALAHFLRWQRDTFAIGPEDRCAQLTSLSFDVVLRDILTPLISGATLCLPPVEEDLSAGALFPWFRQQRITSFHTVPTIVKSWLLSADQVVPLPDLRRLFFAGELLPASLVRQWRGLVNTEAEIVNLYGPTETTLAKCFYRVPPAATRLPQTLPVGQAMSDSQALVLNAQHQQCGIGEPGEIVIRTRFPSLGYLHGGRQAPAFICNPFTGQQDDLFYFTGDVGQVRHDGVVCLTGRRDDQVKIRGMRVEPGEIGAALLSHPAIQDVAITIFSDAQDEKRIAAYYVAAHPVPEAEVLRQHLQARLPSYMQPAAWMAIDRLPMTPNGKLDRRRLPDPHAAMLAVRKQGYIAPSSESERQVAAVWARVLRSDEPGVSDNFFDIGGHSLLLLQVKNQLQATLQRDIPVVALFQYPTIAAFAAWLDEQAPQQDLMAEADARISKRREALQRRRRR
ncbi:Malonyl CoA-acyl carrier protein transacylase [Serratia rubidaea]|uniref:non-ribosomal peptide synthetase n=1 Tax=Serratia rubidaea TaxID=61652 RepID=UPI00078AF9DA|nr:non-ribosomal peptide synthetase [Serratia rubidaea]AML57741.1 Malonyl CoA-acyl carrier protein transacylase [Serratia rubidaea]